VNYRLQKNNKIKNALNRNATQGEIRWFQFSEVQQ
jgi:hypothetical protein